MGKRRQRGAGRTDRLQTLAHPAREEPHDDAVSIIAWNEEIEVTLFNRPWIGQFRFGETITLFGVYQGNGKIVASNYNLKPLSAQTGLRPVYSLTKGMKPADMQAAIKAALKHVRDLPDLIPSRYRQKYRLLDNATAYEWIHEPRSMRELHQAIRTLKYEEFLCFQCCVQAQQVQTITKEAKVFDQKRIEEKIAQFKFPLTPDQQSAIDDVLRDMRSDTIMYRMIQGDVGCGKTIVAMMSLFACELAGYQCAFLAPTEILARQHYENLKALGLPASLLVASLPAKEKRDVLAGLEEGEIRIVVGTHALFQEKVNFEKLGLVVADEQQRFGVNQRRALLEKGKNVDFLMMSATPIPRTYAHFLYGDIRLSSIRTMPPGRKPVLTRYVPGTSMKSILSDVLAGIDEGRQCYVVCPMIDENLETNLRAVTTIYEGMVKTLGDKYRVGLLHGKIARRKRRDHGAVRQQGVRHSRVDDRYRGWHRRAGRHDDGHLRRASLWLVDASPVAGTRRQRQTAGRVLDAFQLQRSGSDRAAQKARNDDGRVRDFRVRLVQTRSGRLAGNPAKRIADFYSWRL